MTIINHWGKWIDSSTPTTGVLSSNDVAWEWLDDEICLTCEEIQNEVGEDELDWIECDSSHTKIIGDWIYDTKTKQYEPDKNAEFAAIENESTIQVVWSEFTTKQCKPCSPCYPGQLDVDYDYENGEFIAYTLPDYLLNRGL